MSHVKIISTGPVEAKVDGYTQSFNNGDIVDFNNTLSFVSSSTLTGLDSTHHDTSTVTDFSDMFYKCTNLTTVPLLNTSSGTDFTNMFSGCTKLTTIPLLNTSSGTDFTNMFGGCIKLTTVPALNTSNATSFSSMFRECNNLTTVPLLDTSSGTNFAHMFYNCTSLTTIPLLDTSNGTFFFAMFRDCTNLTTVPALDTSKGTNFSSLFYKCTSLTTIPLLDTSNGTDFSIMFQYCTNLTSIPLLDTSNGTDFTTMFQHCTSLTTIPLLDTSNGTAFYRMFEGCTSLTTVPALNTSKGTSFYSMFQDCPNLVVIKGLDISSTASTYQVFTGCDSLQAPDADAQSKLLNGSVFYISNYVKIISTGPVPVVVDGSFKTYNNGEVLPYPNTLKFLENNTLTGLDPDIHDTSETTDFENMFRDCKALTSVPLIDTSNGTNFTSMFRGCINLTTIPLINTSNGTNFSYMVAACTRLTSVPFFDTSKGTNFSHMVNSCSAITTIPLFNTSNGTIFYAMLALNANLTTVPLLDTSMGTNFSSMFESCANLATIPPLNTSNGTIFTAMFSNDSSLTTVPVLDTSKGTSFEYMFNGCTSLTTIEALDTTKKINIQDMFKNTPVLVRPNSYEQTQLSIGTIYRNSSYVKITSGNTTATVDGVIKSFGPNDRVYFDNTLNLSGGNFNIDPVDHDTSKVTDFSNMFNGYWSIHTVPQLDTSSGVNFSGMFYKCTNLSIVPEIDTSKGTNFSNMFYNCSSLESIPLLDTSSGTDFSNMFAGSGNMTSVPSLETSQGTNFSSMFRGCVALTTVPLLDTSIGTNFNGMFYACSALTSVPALNTANGTDYNNMFSNCYNLSTIAALQTNPGAITANMFISTGNLVRPDANERAELLTGFNYRLASYIKLQSTGAVQTVVDGSANTFNNGDVVYFNNRLSFTNSSLLYGIDANMHNTSEITDFTSMFENCAYITTVPLLDTSNGTNFNSMFNGCTSLTTIPLLNTSKGTSFTYMLQDCSSLTTIPLLDTSSGGSFNSMFNGCSALTSVPLLNTAGSDSLFSMFSECTSLTTVPLLNTATVTSIQRMFYGCTSLVSVPLLNLVSCSDMTAAFYNCSRLEEVPLLNTSNCINFTRAFSGCTSLITLPELDFSKGESFNGTFYGCSGLIELPAMDTAKGTSFETMFYGCNNLETIYALNTTAQTSTTSMFNGTTDLKDPSLPEQTLLRTGYNYVYSAKRSAIYIISTYADNQSVVPVINNYITAGITGVDVSNINRVNAAIASLTSSQVDTDMEIQAVVDGLLSNEASMAKIMAYAFSSDNPAPSVGDYNIVGVVGVSTSNIAYINNEIDLVTAADVNTTAKIQAIVNAALVILSAIRVISTYADNQAVVPVLSNYTKAGVLRVTNANIGYVNEAIIKLSSIEVDTTSEIQEVVDLVILVIAAVAKISRYADNQSVVPTVTDYSLVGVVGINSSSLPIANTAIAAVTSSQANTEEKIQNIVYDAVLQNRSLPYAKRPVYPRTASDSLGEIPGNSLVMIDGVLYALEIGADIRPAVLCSEIPDSTPGWSKVAMNDDLDESMGLGSLRNFIHGTLVTTDIDYSKTNGDAFLLEIKANSYSSGLPSVITIQGYIYSNKIIELKGISTGNSITGMEAFNHGGKLCFWWPRQGYWIGYTITVTVVTGGGRKRNSVNKITDSVKPAGVTKVVSITDGTNIVKVWDSNSLKVDSLPQYKNEVTLSRSANTSKFIAELTDYHGCFKGNAVTLKCSWSYAGNSDLITDNVGTIELAGCVIETWGSSATKHVRITRPNTGTGGAKTFVYNDQGAGYSPGWRSEGAISDSLEGTSSAISASTKALALVNDRIGTTVPVGANFSNTWRPVPTRKIARSTAGIILGHCSAGGTVTVQNNGGIPWTASRTGKGRYRVYHNLGTSSYRVVTTAVGSRDTCTLHARTTTYFDIETVNHNNGSDHYNTAFDFVLFRI